MKRVLIITYYWVPSGGSGVQRWVKFSKYLRDFGWEPIIYTPENPEYPVLDPSFEKEIPEGVEVIKTPIWEPYNVYRNLLGKKGQTINAGFITENHKAGWKERLSIWIRGNFLIPDPRRFWVAPSVRCLNEYLQKNPVDAIVSTGPPHSMHLIAEGIKKLFPFIPWIADFRDPWTQISFYKDLGLTAWADRKHHRFEQRVLSNADTVLVVSQDMKREFVAKAETPVVVIPNGYDHDDISTEPVVLDKKFTLSHIGTLTAAQNPLVLWKALSQLCVENDDFAKDLSIQLVGKVDFSVFEAIESANLNQQLIRIDYLNHKEAVLKQQRSQVLLLLINNTPNAGAIITGKLFEYLAVSRPILGIGPVDGDAAKILNETSAGEMLDYNDIESVKSIVMQYYQLYKLGKLSISAKSVDHYSRRELTRTLTQTLNQLSNHA